ncbi:helicase-related protein [Thermosynechococcus sp. NK55a]|uniref:helicase-related protein n=1 Tax=Thermosynechococcus sp. NK55a TaxID=1394889 RepID=UPI00059CA7E3|nr:helicase-related protein [Thermosynechococcus sp. NK55a]
MPQIYDNTSQVLADGLRQFIGSAQSCAFCVGYLNLRGWDQLADLVDKLPGRTENAACRVLVGMHRPPEEEMKVLASLRRGDEIVDGPTLARLKRHMTESFKQQLEFGVPSAQAERTLRQLAAQLRARKVFLKAFLRYPLHAKLYLVRRNDPVTPLIGFVGSSNLTLAGLSHQGELNVDVVEQDAATKLQAWFDERWQDGLAIDLSDTLAELIERSWARTDLVRPYLLYLKIAYHLSEEARQGEREFRLPRIFTEKGTPLLDFQERAVSLAAHYLYRRGGVLLGDVVGLGKTLMATAIARIFQEDDQSNTLVVCPPKLAPMWEQYLQTYEIHGRVLSLGKVETLGRDDGPRYRLLIIDESHNLRNRKSKRYRALRDYIERNEPRVLLLTATPYNKHFTDLGNQLRLFLDENQDLHVRPERFFQAWAADGKSEMDFIARFQTSPHSLRAFEQSPYAEDWRDLMRLFLVRRTRQFIMSHYATFDEEKQRYYVLLNDRPAYFPLRVPKRLEFPIRENDPTDQYARLFRDDVVEVIERLTIPRYGLAQYLVDHADRDAKGDEKRILDNLNRAGRRLIGFCRTNLFKRLESSGHSFLLSVRRHILRNLVTLYALEHGLHIPIGTQDAAMLDTAVSDSDADEEFAVTQENLAATANDSIPEEAALESTSRPFEAFRNRARSIYYTYATQFRNRRNRRNRFDWLDLKFFRPELRQALEEDTTALLGILARIRTWNPNRDAKLEELTRLLTTQHSNDKVLIFTQFADTAQYLKRELSRRGLRDLEVVTNQANDPVALARQFSPSSNGGLRPGEQELRILIATDVLAEGQNLQDAHIIVNYDLPWAIIRLIQRAGRVDRIGQQHDTILVYSFLPAEGVERLIRLRQRLFLRLQQNREVIGTDETFFGEEAANKLRDLYTEKAGTLDDDQADEDIDLASLAFQVWKSASEPDQKEAIALPSIVSATRALPETADPAQHPPGVITYLRYPDGTDVLVRVDERGELVSQSISAIFSAAACAPDEPALPRAVNHHELVARCVGIATEEQTALGGQLGSLRSVRHKLYERLKRYRQQLQAKPTPSSSAILPKLDSVLDRIWRYPLKQAAKEALSRQMHLDITDEALLELVLRRAADENLCEVTTEDDHVPAEPRIICSMGLALASTMPANTGDDKQ